MRYCLILLPTILLTVFSSTIHATIIHVPGDQSTMQGGINGAVNGEMVMVDKGTNTETDTVVPFLPYRRIEIPDNEYIPISRESQRTSPAYHYSGRGIFTTQVNVNSSGENIIGDAANEPSIAVDPLDPGTIAIGWRQFDTIASNFRQAGWGYTADGGITWTFPGVIEPGIFRSDPVLAFDSEGNFYYNSLAVEGNDFWCDVFKSTDGGATWDLGTFAQGGDKQWMGVDRSGGIGNGNHYAYWTSYYSICEPDFFTRSPDGGISYEECDTIPGLPYWGTLDVGPDGELYVGGAGGYDYVFVVSKSSNAQDSSQTVSWDFSSDVDLDGYISSGEGPNPGGLLGQAWIATDHSTGPTRGNVYLLCSVDRFTGPDPLDVMFARSTDGGETWSSPVRVNDDPGTSAYQWFGTMSVAPNGRIDVIWLDTRDDPGGYDSALYYSYSTDKGDTWSPNERMSDSFDPHVGWPQQQKMGDYFHMVSDDTGAHLAWAGTFNGEQDVYYSHIWPTESGISLYVYPSGSVFIPRGEFLEFSSYIQNNTDRTVSGDYWLSVMLPNYVEVLIPEGLLNYSNPLHGQILPFGSLELSDELWVHPRADTGSYQLIGRIGNYPETIIDEESFGFQVVK